VQKLGPELRALNCSTLLLPHVPQSNLHSLTRLHVSGYIHEPVIEALGYVLKHNRSIQDMQIMCSSVKKPLSPIFQINTAGLPLLKSFLIHVDDAQIYDGLFPTLADFLRGRVDLHSLGLSCGSASAAVKTEFNAAIWGLLPTLPNLRALSMSITEDAAPGLVAWLLPRGLRALTLNGTRPTVNHDQFLQVSNE
jgi:hypothetical protein